MTNLLDGSYLCQATGQDVEVLEGKVSCPAIQKTGDCGASKPNLSGCSVYIDANRAYIQGAQSQAKCTASIEEDWGPFGKHPHLKDGPIGPTQIKNTKFFSSFSS